VVSTVFWACVLPMAIIALLVIGGVRPEVRAWAAIAAVLLCAAYPLLLVRMYMRSRKLGRSSGDSWIYAWFCLIAKWPQLQGHMRYWMGR
jgi:hypothetical protein